MSDVLLVLGAAVVKSALKIWLKDASFGSDPSASVVDLVKSKIAGVLEQRQAQRFFEDLEVPVAKRLQVLRESEFASLPDNEWQAAVLAAGSSFDRARLTARDLFTRDLDPLFLEQQIRPDGRTATWDLSAAGTALYDRLISEGCAHIIEIADKLPQFQAGAYAELLRRDREILHLIGEVLERIPAKAEGEADYARFVTAYLRHLATKLDRLELFGLDFESAWYPLSIAYVSLSTSAEVNGETQRIEDRLAANSRTMLVGRAGSGKTTVLQWLAVRAARSDFTGALAKLNDYIPFFVRLREYVNRALPQPEGFIAGVSPLLVPEMPRSWARDQLRSSRALVLIDGVDELPEDQRPGVAMWLQDLMELFPDARYVVTARPAAVRTGWLDQLSFRRAHLESMPPPLAATFVRRWHDATRHRLADADERAQLDDYERALLAVIDDDRYLRDLADTPLLAGLLCALNRHLRSQLPRRRSEIYERALAMFDQRDKARGIAAGQVVLDLAAKTHLLAGLALWMVRNGESDATTSVAAARLGRSMSVLGDTAYQADMVFRVLLERSGLLREPAAGRVDFVHRTFQEFLAAKAAVDGDAIGELVRNAGDDQWREMVVLAAGQANQPQARQLVQGLLRKKWQGEQGSRRRLLAVRCLPEILSLDRNLRRAAERNLPDLLPPRSMDEAEELSTAGKPLIQPLSRYWTREPDMGPETIRAASLVGGSAALDLIEKVVVHSGGERNGRTEAEVSRAWQYFDADEYARRVLTARKFTKLTISDLRLMEALVHVTSVRELELGPFVSAELEPLAALPELEKLTIAILDSHYLSGLAECPRLKRLAISDYTLSDLSPLPYIPTLTSLQIIKPLSLKNLSGIGRQVGLTHVRLTECRQLETLSSLASLPRLQSVQLFECGELNIGRLASRPDVTVEFVQNGRVFSM